MIRQEFDHAVQNQKRDYLIDVLYFLLKNMAVHKKRAYLSIYLTRPEVPDEFMHQDGIFNLRVGID